MQWCNAKMHVALHNSRCYVLSIGRAFTGLNITRKAAIMVKSVKSETLIPVDATEMADQFRAYAETAVEQSRDAYAKLKVSMEDAQKTVETTFEKVQAANSDFGLKTIAAVRKSTDASLSHMEKLMGVKSFATFVELQTAFIRQQAELVVEQSKLLQDAAQKVATDVSAPAKAAYEKVAKELKVA
jgi:phasin